MIWQELKSQDIGALSGEETVLLSVAAIEQHGPHLPVGTDSLIAESIASSLDKKCGDQLLLLPVQRVGYSHHHRAFPGTVTLSHETLAQLLVDMLSSVFEQGFSRVLVLNSHGGNRPVGEMIAQKAAELWPDSEVLFTSWWRVAAEQLKSLVEGDYPSVGHACEFETSLMLHLFPELVDMALAVDDGIPPAAEFLQGDLLTRNPAASRVFTFDRITKQGVFGRPTLASPEKGARILDIVVRELETLIVTCWPDAVRKLDGEEREPGID